MRARPTVLARFIGGAVAGTAAGLQQSCGAVTWTLVLLDDVFAVCRLAADAPPPGWAVTGPFVSMTSHASTSCRLVCRLAEDVPG